MAKSIKLKETLRREVALDRALVKEDSRTVEICFSSESPVERFFGTEVLDHTDRSVDLTRLNRSAPLLLNHDPERQVGVIESARVDSDKKGRAVVRFSKSPLGEEIFQDVKDGIRTLASVGYRIHKLETEKQSAGQEIQRAVRWEPLEVSIVSIPADTSVGVGRSETEPAVTVTTSTSTMSEPITVTPPATQPRADDVLAAERKRIADINEIAEQHNCHDLARKAAKEGTSVSDFQADVLRTVLKAKPSKNTDAFIGMNDREIGQFSLLRACRQLATKGRLEGIEKEACDAAVAKIGRDVSDKAIVIPHDVFARAQNVTTATAGGHTVAPQFGPMIELLRNATVVAEAGATQLTGLVGDVYLPKHTGGSTAYWVAETGALTDSQSTFGQVKLAPHRLGATVPYSTQFLAQSSVDAEGFIRGDLMKVLAIAKDLAALEGTGGAQPIGVKNTSGINATVTYGGAATWADVVEHETGIAVDNADIGSMAFILSASTVGKWKTILKDSVAGAGYLIEDMAANGYRVLRTNQVTGNISFFGVWAQVVMASWAGIEVIVDPYALKKSGQVEITVNELCDIAVRQPLAFNVSTDSAAQ